MVAVQRAVGVPELVFGTCLRLTLVLAFVVAVSAIASQATRVFGLLILGLDLRDGMSGSWELWTFWSCLALATSSC